VDIKLHYVTICVVLLSLLFFPSLIQLDVKTKLCIRDGLYRLARSAQNRPVFPNAVNSHGDSQDVKDTQNADTSGRYGVFLTEEHTFANHELFIFGFGYCCSPVNFGYCLIHKPLDCGSVPTLSLHSRSS
jgi:hypothetical protein